MQLDPTTGLIVAIGASLVFVGYIFLSVAIGVRAARWVTRRNPQSAAGRIAAHYITWGVLTGIFMCAAVGASAIHIGLSAALFGPFCFGLGFASVREPEPKTCKCCGGPVCG